MDKVLAFFAGNLRVFLVDMLNNLSLAPGEKVVKKRNQCLVALATLTLVFFCTIPAMAAVVLSTPTGLAPGAKFRYIFLTSGTTTATSTDIATYNSFVNLNADSSTYNGKVVTWAAVGSTATVSARDNVGGYGTSVPVYLVDGTIVADNLTTGSKGLWSGTLPVKIDMHIDKTIDATAQVFTGSSADGTINSLKLGDARVTFGYSDSINSDYWITHTNKLATTASYMYAVSQELTNSVPEPSTYILLSIALGVVGFARMKMKKTA